MSRFFCEETELQSAGIEIIPLTKRLVDSEFWMHWGVGAVKYLRWESVKVKIISRGFMFTIQYDPAL